MRLEPELQDSYAQWKQNWNLPENNTRMLRKIQPWVDQALIAAGGRPANPAMRAKANLMAMAYLRQYDPEKSSLKNFLYGQLRGLHRVVGTDQNIIQIPERIVLGRKAIAEAEKELTDELGRFPSRAEVADRTGIPLKTIDKWMRASVPLSESAVNSHAEGGDTLYASTSLGSDKAELAWQSYIYDSLNDRSRAVMERLYGMHGFKPTPPAEIAKQLKISQAAVSQHKKKIDALLDDDSRYSLFGG